MYLFPKNRTDVLSWASGHSLTVVQHSAGGCGAPIKHLTLCRGLWLRPKKGQCWAVAGLPYPVMEGKDRSESREPGSCPEGTERKEKELILFCPHSLLAASFPAATGRTRLFPGLSTSSLGAGKENKAPSKCSRHLCRATELQSVGMLSSAKDGYR